MSRTLKQRNKTAFVFGITNNWAFTTGTVLLGLQRYKPLHEYDVVIYHKELSDKNKKLLDRIHPCTFVAYHSPLVHPHKFQRISELSFARFKCFGLLSTYKKVIWLDSDILIKGNINGLIYGYNEHIAMYRHANTPISVSFSSPVPGFDMKRDCFNAGILVVNSNLKNYRELEQWCYAKANQWIQHINSDQAIINLMIQQFSLQVSELDEKYNCNPDRDVNHAVIIHAWGKPKFWNGRYFPLWDIYLSQWKRLGGEGPARSFLDKMIIFGKRLKLIT